MQANKKTKYVLSIILATIAIIVLFNKNLFCEKSQSVPILMYHKVDSNPHSGGLGLRVPCKKFDWQIKFLYSHGYHSVTIDDVVKHFKYGNKLPSKPIVISFDDGYENNYKYALPILKKYNFKATIFLVYNTLNKTNIFDKPFHQPTNKMLTYSEVYKLIKNGIEIGSHTLNHPILTKVSINTARKEITDSKTNIEKRFGINIKVFCYPHGKYNSNIKVLVKQAGYECAITTDQGVNNKNSDLYALKRIRIMGKYNNAKFLHELNKFQ